MSQLYWTASPENSLTGRTGSQFVDADDGIAAHHGRKLAVPLLGADVLRVTNSAGATASRVVAENKSGSVLFWKIAALPMRIYHRRFSRL